MKEFLAFFDKFILSDNTEDEIWWQLRETNGVNHSEMDNF